MSNSTEKKKTYFPILIKRLDTKEEMRCETNQDIPEGVSFIVLETRVK
jgi:hypothetical protein